MFSWGDTKVKFIKWIDEHKALSVLIALVLFFVPIIIVHILFKIIAPYKWLIADWNSGDILVYCGSMFGAVATIVAIILTIRFTEYNQKQERRLSSRPLLQTENLYCSKEKALEEKANLAIYITYPFNENNEIGSSREPQYVITKPQTQDKTKATMEGLYFARDYYLFQYNVKNVGAGNAAKLLFTIDKKPVMPPFSIAVNETKIFVVLLKAELIKDEERLIYFEFEFEDVASLAKYEQHEQLLFYKDKEEFLTSSQKMADIITMPREIPTRSLGDYT